MPNPVSRDMVVAVALQRFRAGGYGAISLRGVADELGITAPALYRLFDNKSDLVAALLEQGFQDLMGRLASALAAATPSDRLRGTMAAFLDFALAEPRVYQTLTYPADEPEIREVVRRLHAPAQIAFQFLTDRVREAIHDGSLVSDDPRKAALVLWSHSQGLISMYLSAHIEMKEDAFRRLYWDCTNMIGRDLRPAPWSGA